MTRQLMTPELLSALALLVGLPGLNDVRSIKIDFKGHEPIIATVEMYVPSDERMLEVVRELEQVEIKRNIIIDVMAPSKPLPHLESS